MNKNMGLNQRIAFVAKLFLHMQTLLYLTDGVTVHMQLKTTGCLHNCILAPSNSSCPSSILINGKEYSHQKDGFNIAVIDNKFGHIRRHYFNYFTKRPKKSLRHLLPPTETDFQNYFSNVTENSTIVVLLQNICAHFDKRWYNYLKKSGIKIASLPKYWYSHDVALLIGCKGFCLESVDIPLPFGYFGNDEAYEVSISNRHDKVSDDSISNKEEAAKGGLIERRREEKLQKNQGHLGSVLGGIIAFIFMICIATVLYITNRRSVDENDRTHDSLFCWRRKDKSLIPEITQKEERDKKEPLLVEEPRYETMDPYRHQNHELKKPIQNVYEEIPDHKAEKETLTPVSAQSQSHVPLRSVPVSDEPVYEVITPLHLSEDGRPNPSTNKDMCENTTCLRDANNIYYQPTHKWNEHSSSEIMPVSSLINQDCQSLNSSPRQPKSVASVCSVAADTFLNDKKRIKQSRSSSSRRHGDKQCKKNHHKHTPTIDRSESVPSFPSYHQSLHQYQHHHRHHFEPSKTT